MEEEVDLIEILKIFWNKKIFIILTVLISLVIGYIYSYYFITPQYTSKTTIVLTKDENANENTITQTDVTLNQQLVNTYAELIKTNNVLKQVIETIGEEKITQEELKNSISVKLISSTQLIEISVTNKDASLAKELTNEISKVFIEKIKEIYNMQNLNIVDYAKQSVLPSNINHTKDLMTFGVIGALVSMLAIFVIYLMGSSVKKIDVIEKELNLVCIASIPKYPDKNELVLLENPKSPISEAFRMLRANVQFMSIDNDLKTLLVTSSGAEEGKSFVTSNLAIAFAKENKKVLIIDADMRKGRLDKVFAIEKAPGLSNYLSNVNDFEDNENIENYIKNTNLDNISVMPTGNVPPNPAELLESEKLKTLIETVKEKYDIVIFDTAPCLLVTDAMILARQVDSVMIVGKYKKTKLGELEKTKKMLENIESRTIGLVLNQTPFTKKEYKNNYYYGKEKTKESIKK